MISQINSQRKKSYSDTKYKDTNSGFERLGIRSIFPKIYHYAPALFLTLLTSSLPLATF